MTSSNINWWWSKKMALWLWLVLFRIWFMDCEGQGCPNFLHHGDERDAFGRGFFCATTRLFRLSTLMQLFPTLNVAMMLQTCIIMKLAEKSSISVTYEQKFGLSISKFLIRHCKAYMPTLKLHSKVLKSYSLGA